MLVVHDTGYNMQIRKYLIISSSLVPQVDFSQVWNTSADTLRYSNDDTLAIIKYDVILDDSGTVISGRPSVYTSDMTDYTLDEISEILLTDINWKYIPTGSI